MRMVAGCRLPEALLPPLRATFREEPDGVSPNLILETPSTSCSLRRTYRSVF